MSAVIAFEGLTKKFGAVTALDDLTAEVAPGRITAFLGPNGSGKTISMRLPLGLDAPTPGTASAGGRAQRRCGERGWRRLRAPGPPDAGGRGGRGPGVPPVSQRSQPRPDRRRP